MKLGELFPCWRAASSNPRTPWEFDIDVTNAESVGGVLILISEDQSSSSYERPDEFDAICRAIVEDILALAAAPPGRWRLGDLRYLQFHVCEPPIWQAFNLGDFGQLHDWIGTSIGDDVAHGVERHLYPRRIWDFAEAAPGWIVANRGEAFASWATSFYYYARKRATLVEAAGGVLPAVVAVLRSLGPGDPQAIDAQCMAAGWASVYQPASARPLADGLRAMFELPHLEPRTRTRIAVFFATNAADLSDRPPREWAALAFHAGTELLAPHEPFQLVWSQVESIDDWKRIRPTAFDAATRYAISLRLIGLPTARERARDQRSALLRPPFVKMATFDRSDDFLAILTRWYDVPPDRALTSGILFISTTHHAGTAFIGAAVQIMPLDEVNPLPDLVALTNRALGLAITVEGQAAELAVPDRAGEPDYPLGARFREALAALYRFDDINPAVLADRRALVAFPAQPHPVQALMSEMRGGETLPISASLELPAADRPLHKALLWAAGNDNFSGFEMDAVQAILEAAGVECDRRSGEGKTPRDFLGAYTNQDFDLVWVAGHGEIDHWSDGSARLVVGEGALIGIDALALRTRLAATRRLLVLNICDGGVAAINGGIHRLGMAPTLARADQAVISHLWPVRPPVSAAFGTLLAGELTKRQGFFQAYASALSLIRARSADVTDSVRRLVPEQELVMRLERTDLETGNIFNWGSAAYFQ